MWVYQSAVSLSLFPLFQVSLKDLYKLDELAEKKGVTDLNDETDPKKT